MFWNRKISFVRLHLRWLTTVSSIRAQLLTLLKKVPSCFSLHYLLIYLSLLPFYVKFEQLNINKWPVPSERLGTSRLGHVFLKIYPYDPASKFQDKKMGLI